MEFMVDREAVCVNELLYEGSVEQPVDSDMTLPDYCPDIQRILKCVMIPQITGSQVSGDRITVDGNAVVRLIYVCENGKIHCFEQNFPFSRFVEIKNFMGDPCVRVRARVEYVNCRAVSQRRADIHGTFCLMIRATAKKQEELIAGANGLGVQLRRKSCEASTIIADVERAFSLSEVLEIGDTKPPIAQVVRSNASAVVQEVKIINNKILLKGELVVRTLYCSDSEDASLESIEHTMPISQIIECEGITEECGSDLRLSVTCLETAAKADSSGEMRLLDISARICAEIHACRMIEVPAVTDAYSTQCEIGIERRMIHFDKLIEIFSDTTLCRNTIDLSGNGVTQVLDLWCSDETASASQRENAVFINGSVTVCMLIMDAQGQPGYLERQADYEYRREMRQQCDQIKCEPSVSVLGCDFVMNSGEKLDLRIELSLNASVFQTCSDKLITEITPNETKPKRNNTAALTIYFSDAGESVWNIARRYNTTVEAILRENKMTEDTLPQACMLLIPGV